MTIDKTKLKEPRNTEENRETLADIVANDMSVKEMRQKIRDQLIISYKISNRDFLKSYWRYFEETYGHCPFGINGD